MAPIASSLASKFKSWVVIDDTFATDGKVVICQVCDKKILLWSRNWNNTSEVLFIQNTNSCSVPRSKYFWPKCKKNLESGLNFSKTYVMQWWLQIFHGTNSKCQNFVHSLKSTARRIYTPQGLSACVLSRNGCKYRRRDRQWGSDLSSSF
jgi:hypothetical protein